MRRSYPLAVVSMAAVASVPAWAQVRDVQIVAERSVGYVIGDLIPYAVDVGVDAGWTLQRASLPTPGRPQYWLELRDVAVAESAAGDATRYRVNLTYQSFYAPLEARTRTIAGFVLTFERDGKTIEAVVPPRTITMSPLREIVTASGDLNRGVALQPDRAATPMPTRTLAIATLASALASVALALLIAWQRAAWPFRRRPDRPFASARSDLRKQPDYAAALRRLHRAFDAAAGYRLLADDQARFLAAHARFSAAATDIAAFFAASRALFFGDDEARAHAALAPEGVLRLARRMAALERTPA